jgi:predicted TPR repeat methyltransferase
VSRNRIVALQRAVALNPYNPDAYYRLCRELCAAGLKDYAEDIFHRWMRVDPDDPGIPYLRAALLGEGNPSRAPEEYIAGEFDQFADSFDSVLHKLEYRVPELIEAALTAELGAPGRDLRVLDAGCGTGLCGRVVRPYARVLTGVDLSEGMLAVARQRECYDELIQGELVQQLRAVSDPFELIVSGDCLVYFGDLEPVFSAAFGALRNGGLLAFSLESRECAGSGYGLTATGRFSHSEDYARSRLEQADLKIHRLENHVLRWEEGVPVAGLICLAARSGTLDSATSPGPVLSTQ